VVEAEEAVVEAEEAEEAEVEDRAAPR